MTSGTDDDEYPLVSRAAAGDDDAFADLLGRHEPRLRRQVRMRLDPRILPRVDVSDVLQEVRIEAHARLREFAAKREVPFFIWLRFLTQQRMAQLHRFHFGAHARDARREVRAPDGAGGASTSASMAAELAGSVTSPSNAAQRAETEERLRAALDAMDPLDREILCLRHFEQLGNAEAAQELGINISAASKRYIRALRRLKEIVGPGGRDALGA